MRIDVVIPSSGRIELALGCLASLHAMHHAPNAITVVFQGRAVPELTERIAAAHPFVKVIWISTVGASAARNAGAAISEADVVAFVDDDCTVTPNWIDVIATVFEDRRVTLASGMVLPEGTNGIVLAGQMQSASATYSERRNPVGTVDRSGNMAIRRTTLTAVGGFDESLGPGTRYPAAEDTDLIYRMMSVGATVYYAPTMRVVHRHRRNAAGARAAERGYAIGLGALIAKHAIKGDVYAVSLLPRLLWHMGLRPVVRGALDRDFPHIGSGLRYLVGIPRGFIARLVAG